MNKLILRITLFLVVIFNMVSANAANYYWRATAVNNLYTNVGNWETSPGNSITPGVAPTSNDSVFFLVSSNYTTINMDGGNSGVFTVSGPTIYSFNGTGNFYGDINADGNIMFNNGSTLNFVGTGVKNINLDSNPNTSVSYFTGGGSLNFNEGTVNLNHNLLAAGCNFNLSSSLTLFNSNSFNFNCSIFTIGNNASAVYNFSNSKVEARNITYRATNTANLIMAGTRLILNNNSGYVFYSYGTASLSMQSLSITGTGNIQWYGRNISFTRLDSLIIGNSQSITIGRGGDWFVDSVLIIEKPTTLIGSNLLDLKPNRIETPPLCQGQSTFSGFTLSSISPITINTISFKTIDFTGGSFTSSSTNDIVNNSGAGITWTGPLLGQTFHWIGGSGDWNDPTEWSLLGSGGAPQLASGCVPTYADSVVFDNNSFSSIGDTVNTVSLQAKCRSITNIDPANEGVFNGNVSVNGNANFTGASAVHSIDLVGPGNHTLTSGVNFTYTGVITVNSNGNYVLMDDIISFSDMRHTSGGLDFNSNDVDVDRFYSTSIPGLISATRTLDISNSNLITNSRVEIYGLYLTFLDATNSSIYVESPSGIGYFRHGTLQLNDLYFTATTGTSDIYTNSVNLLLNDLHFSSDGTASYQGYTASTLNLASGKRYTFSAGRTYNILTSINTIISSCNDLVTIESRTPGSQANFNKASLPFTTSGIIVKDIEATGVPLTINNGVDLGNNTNVIITPGIGRDMYWVNGTGNWDDGIGHWSIGVSEGNPTVTNPSGCLPRPIDNVFFDTNSFNTTGQVVTLNATANCLDMIWDTNAVSFNPILSGASTIDLNIYGDLQLRQGLTNSHLGTLNFRGALTGINTQTIDVDSVLTHSRIDFNGGGRYDFISDINGSSGSRFALSVGHLYTNGYTISSGAVSLNLIATNSADITNSLIDILLYIGYTANHYSTTNFTALGSHIISPQYVRVRVLASFTDTIKYHNITVKNISTSNSIANNDFTNSPVSFNKIVSTDHNQMVGTFIIDTLVYHKSSVNTLHPSGSYTVLDTLIAFGSPCVPISIRSSVPGTPANLRSGNCNFDIEFGVTQDLTADISMGCVATDYRVFGADAGGNSNLNFVTPPATNQLGNDTNVYCANAPYTINTDGFGNAPAIYLWNTGDTTKTIITDTNGTFHVRVDYGLGCIASDTVVVLIIDTVPPVIICPLDSTVFLDNSCQYVLADFTDSIAVDDCTQDSSLILIQSPIVGTIYNGESIQTIWLYAEDNYGNIDSCSFQLTMSDSTNPTVTCKDTTIHLDGTGQYIIDTSYILANATDNCGIDSIWTNDTLYDCSTIGLNTATVYARDVNGNVDSCIANVTVIDSINPTVVCKDTTLYLNVNGTYTIDTSYIHVSNTDNCGIDRVWTNDTLYNCSNIGLNTATLYVRDVNGNIDSCQAQVTVIDSINPIIVCKDTTVYLSPAGTYTIDTSYVLANLSDNCGIDSVWLTPTSFTCADTGANTVMIYALDASNNLDSCQATVTVLDTVNPVITCNDTTIYLNTTGQSIIDTSYVYGTSSASCGIDSIWTNDTLFTCANTGINIATIYARDLNGNIDSCQSQVTVLDTLNPTVVCKDTTIYLNILGQYIIDTSYIHVSNNDNCGVDSVWTNDTLYNCSNIGINQAIIYVRDVNGNTDSCIATVTVVDTLNPIVSCQDTTIYLSSAGTYVIDTSYVLASLSDNCGIDSVWLNQTSFTCTDTGANTVMIYALDVNGNSDSCQATVTVLDTVNPTVSCQNATIYLDTNGQFIIDTSYVYSSSFAGCGLDSIWIADSVFDCSRIGTNAISVYARDVNGNIDSCQAQVMVLDTVNPTIITCGSTLYDTVSNSCEFIVPDFRTSTLPIDNCTDSINFQITQTPTPGTVITVQDQQIQNITITVADTNGNQAVCMFDVELTCKDEFQIPEFISPNGDGKNDRWIITGIEDYPNNAVKIFNRYGALVYEVRGYQNTWDGTANVDFIFQAGETDKILPSGTYFYRLELDTQNQNPEVYNGIIQIQK